jgi:hypothetical protein
LRSVTDQKLSADFIQAITTAPYLSKIPARKISITGAIVDGDIEIEQLSLDELSIKHSEFRLLRLIEPKIKYLDFSDSTISYLMIHQGEISVSLLNNVRIEQVALTKTRVDAYTVRNSPMSKLSATSVQISEVFRIVGSELELDAELLTIRGPLFFENSSVTLRLRTSVVGSIIFVGGTLFELDIQDVTTKTIGLSYRGAPAKVERVSISGLDFSNWDNTIDFTSDLLKRNSFFSPLLFDRIAKSYREAGDYKSSDEIRYLKKTVEYEHVDDFNKVLWFISWATVGYGIQPWRGFIWFGALVAIGYFVFRGGERSLLSGTKPRSWLVYSIDTVIPVISLEKKHDEIAFVGWRQYYLYSMRLLSAVLAFLVFKFLQDIIVG